MSMLLRAGSFCLHFHDFACAGMIPRAPGLRRRTRRWEAHIWDAKKQVYLGGYDSEEHAGAAPCAQLAWQQ